MILTIDCGTQSIRAALINENGKIEAIEKKEFTPYYSENPGWAEQDADTYWKNLCNATKDLKKKNTDLFEKTKGVVVTTLRDTAVCLDKEGNPIRPIILWLDQRKSQSTYKLAKKHKLMFSIVGMTRTVNIIRHNSKANWLKENEPENWKKTYKYAQVSGFFHHKLTGNFVESTASQIGHLPFDYKNKKWVKSNSSWKWEVFGVEKEKLMKLINPTEIVGYITKKAEQETGIKEGIPVIAGGSDKGCETLANGCINPERVSLSFGTTATAQISTKNYFEPLKFMPPYPAVIPNYYNPEIEIFRGYWMISWFKKEFAEKELKLAKELNVSPEKLLNEHLNKVPPGSHGLVLQPYWGPHVKTPDAKGAVLGFGDIHTRSHLYRAIIEGINYALMDGVEKLEKKSKVKIKEVIVGGGGSQSDSICQITADMFGKPVKKIHTHEASSLGAAIIGFISIGRYKSFEEAINHMIRYKKTFIPNKENHEIYINLFEKVYKKIYPSIKNIYSEIQTITGYPEL